jgi:hypothetical protein
MVGALLYPKFIILNKEITGKLFTYEIIPLFPLMSKSIILHKEN